MAEKVEKEKEEEEVKEKVEKGKEQGQVEEWARGRQKGKEGRQRARKRAIDSNVGDILRRRDREQWEKEEERQRHGQYVCAHVTQRGMTKEGDKARIRAERAGRAREHELGERGGWETRRGGRRE